MEAAASSSQLWGAREDSSSRPQAAHTFQCHPAAVGCLCEGVLCVIAIGLAAEVAARQGRAGGCAAAVAARRRAAVSGL